MDNYNVLSLQNPFTSVISFWSLEQLVDRVDLKTLTSRESLAFAESHNCGTRTQIQALHLQVCTTLSSSSRYLLFLFFWPCHVAWGILVPWSGTEPRPSTVRAWSPDDWTAGKTSWATREAWHIVDAKCRFCSYPGSVGDRNGLRTVERWGG